VTPAVADGGSYGWMLVQTLAALAAVCLLALVALRWGLRRFAGGALDGVAGRGRIRVLERVALDPRRALVLVEIGPRILLVASGEGPTSLLCEIDPATLPPVPERRPAAFRDVLSRALAGRSVAP